MESFYDLDLGRAQQSKPHLLTSSLLWEKWQCAHMKQSGSHCQIMNSDHHICPPALHSPINTPCQVTWTPGWVVWRDLVGVEKLMGQNWDMSVSIQRFCDCPGGTKFNTAMGCLACRCSGLPCCKLVLQVKKLILSLTNLYLLFLALPIL